MALILVAGAIALLSLGGGVQPAKGDAANGSNGTAQVETPLTDDQATDIARSLAASDGDSSPTSIALVRSTHAKALGQIDEGEVTNAVDDAPVVVVVMRGRFTALTSPHPPDSDPPTGSVMTLVLDSETGQALDVGIVDVAPTLSGLGQVSQIAG
jgi:hypothetical protein